MPPPPTPWWQRRSGSARRCSRCPPRPCGARPEPDPRSGAVASGGHPWWRGSPAYRCAWSPSFTGTRWGYPSRPQPYPRWVYSTASGGPKVRLRRVLWVSGGFAGGVAAGLELDGGVLDVEVSGQALLELVEQAGQVPVLKARVVHDDVSRQHRQAGGHLTRMKVVHGTHMGNLI